MHDDIEDGKMDIDAANDRAERTKEIEALGFEAEAFEAIESEFKEFLNEHLKGKDLDKFRQEYQKINKNLKSSYEGEKKLIKKCKELISQIFDKAGKYRAALRMANNEVDKIDALKQERGKSYDEVALKREEEEQQNEQIQKIRMQIADLKRVSLQSTELEEALQLAKLMNTYDELSKTKEEQDERLEAVREKKRELEDTYTQFVADLDKQGDDIIKMRALIQDAEQKKKDKQQEGEDLQQQKKQLQDDNAKQKAEVDEKKQELVSIKEDNKRINDKLKAKEDEIQKKKEQISAENQLYDELKKRSHRDETSKTNETNKREDKQIKLDAIVAEIEKLQELCAKNEKFLEINKRKVGEARAAKEENDRAKEALKTELQVVTEAYETKKKSVDEDRKEIEQKKRERDLLNKDVATAEEKGKEQISTIQTLENELKKLQNKITGYQDGIRKLHKLIRTLESDKYKYGVEASAANARYYSCLEQVKLKNNLITKLQKKNIEAESKLKQQQNLYEAVRSDRNLYSKNLLEAQEEIAELRMKFRRMTQNISQLKEEISSKDQAIIHEDDRQKNHQKKNEQLKADKEKIERNIKSSEEMIKTQESDIARLKYVISEAESEKQKQKKDYEMVINERDILGTQLIKRNEELSLLYEKIKIQKSTLDKGEIYYQERLNDIMNIRKEIANLKKQLIVSQNETSCIPDLKREIYLLQKEQLEQEQKAKYLMDELQKPFNVHRWRKLECTDPETYEMIQKIQSLQKRLIAKTEEVSEKDVLIQEKEKLYIELKNILAKQSGPEVAEKLQVYQQNLKERTNQLKEMVKELKNYQSQVNAYKFEIERLDKQIGSVKELYFNSKQTQAIQEDMAGEEDMDQMNYGSAPNAGNPLPQMNPPPDVPLQMM